MGLLPKHCYNNGSGYETSKGVHCMSSFLLVPVLGCGLDPLYLVSVAPEFAVNVLMFTYGMLFGPFISTGFCHTLSCFASLLCVEEGLFNAVLSSCSVCIRSTPR